MQVYRLLYLRLTLLCVTLPRIPCPLPPRQGVASLARILGVLALAWTLRIERKAPLLQEPAQTREVL